MEAARLHIAWGDAAQLQAHVAQGGLAQALSAQEAARLSSIGTPARRGQFLAARWLLRSLLAQLHGGTPADWPLGAAVDAPPRLLRSTPQPLHLALTHSGAIVACAVAPQPVGLDVEAPQRPRDVAALAQLVCDEAEQAALASRPPPQRESLFYEMWTAKEAWLKRLAQSMAPRRMARIHLAPANDFDGAAVRVWTRGGWTLAVAAAPALAVQWHAPAPVATSAWTVTDEGEPRPALRAR